MPYLKYGVLLKYRVDFEKYAVLEVRRTFEKLKTYVNAEYHRKLGFSYHVRPGSKAVV